MRGRSDETEIAHYRAGVEALRTYASRVGATCTEHVLLSEVSRRWRASAEVEWTVSAADVADALAGAVALVIGADVYLGAMLWCEGREGREGRVRISARISGPIAGITRKLSAFERQEIEAQQALSRADPERAL